jgi:AmiR/NasT family two-component response regulator
METSIRVLVANRPRLLRELVLSTLSEQAGISIVGEAENEKDVPSLVAETKPDFLLIALDGPALEGISRAANHRRSAKHKYRGFLLGFVGNSFDHYGSERRALLEVMLGKPTRTGGGAS